MDYTEMNINHSNTEDDKKYWEEQMELLDKELSILMMEFFKEGLSSPS